METCAGPAREFDFWLGDWVIEQQILNRDGTWLSLPAHSSVSLSPDGCVYTEHWRGEVQFFWETMEAPETVWGYSVRAFDEDAGVWRIYWMDGANPRFDTPYVGGFEEGGRGVFLRAMETDAGARTGRIIFERVGDDIVDWELAVSSEANPAWRTLWRMRMHREQRS